LIAEVCNSKEGHNINCRTLRRKLGMFAKTAYQMLKKNSFKSVKEFTKPGLTDVMKKACLKFCKAYED
jgi:hypothetical protein